MKWMELEANEFSIITKLFHDVGGESNRFRKKIFLILEVIGEEFKFFLLQKPFL